MSAKELTPGDKINQYLDHYQKGIITEGELANRLFQHITDQNVRKIMLSLPNGIMELLLEQAKPMKDGNHYRYFAMGSYILSTPQAVKSYRQRTEREAKQCLRGQEAVYEFSRKLTQRRNSERSAED